ncbi:MAG: hypothetical protein QGM46_04235 [Actinomycetota bacterium]|nr:hypothetical protein [Actinomycetota bacterium]MDK1026536.1 hypothetical protein [Actinomycetota bacterium]MDK1038975.1 hypothetical protein [Actinomycetota bacterium]MDK1103090.1 hypothetical protein [Actinomycetota bacterium]MDK1291543.1 hypothetical protein [Actinomycetota bacterium]
MTATPITAITGSEIRNSQVPHPGAEHRSGNALRGESPRHVDGIVDRQSEGAAGGDGVRDCRPGHVVDESLAHRERSESLGEDDRVREKEPERHYGEHPPLPRGDGADVIEDCFIVGELRQNEAEDDDKHENRDADRDRLFPPRAVWLFWNWGVGRSLGLVSWVALCRVTHALSVAE